MAPLHRHPWLSSLSLCLLTFAGTVFILRPAFATCPIPCCCLGQNGNVTGCAYMSDNGYVCTAINPPTGCGCVDQYGHPTACAACQ